MQGRQALPLGQRAQARRWQLGYRTLCSAMMAGIADRGSRLRRSLKRLAYELVDAEAGQFYIRREGSKVNETADPVPPRSRPASRPG
jgi:hypothetical protein